MIASTEPSCVVVSSSGSSDTDGGRQKIVPNLHSAIEWLAARRRDVPAKREAGDLIVQLEPGIHRLDASVIMGPEVAGCPTSRTVIRGSVGAVLTGARPATPKVPLRSALRLGVRRLRYVEIPPAEGIPLDLGRLGFKLPVPAAPPALSVAGRRLDWVRRPTAGWLRTVAPSGEEQGLHVLKLAPEDLAGLAGQTDLWVETIIGWDWWWYRSRVLRIDADNGHVVLELPARGDRMLPGGDKVCFLNDRRALQEPGSCWLDPQTRRLFYLEATPDTAVELCLNPGHLLRLNQVRHVSIESLHFAHGLASAVEAIDCSDITISDCHVEQFSLSAFHLHGSRFTVRQCRLSDFGLAGIRLISGDADQLVDGNSVVEDCSFERWGRARKVYEPAVQLHGAGTLVRGCSFSDGPHMAIDISGNSHHIDGNKFWHVAKDIDDMGAIYVNLGEKPLQRGHVISHNVFHDIGVDRTIASAVYVDRCSMGIGVVRNLFVRICGDGLHVRRAIHANGVSYLKIVENLFVDCECASEVDFYLRRWGKSDAPLMLRARNAALERINGDVAHTTRYPELLQLSEESPFLPATNEVRDNFVVAPHTVPWCGFVVTGGPASSIAFENNVVCNRQNLSDSWLNLPLIWRQALGDNVSAETFDTGIAALIADWEFRWRQLSMAPISEAPPR